MTYYLIGLFDVNIPMLYEESHRSLLAKSPLDFVSSGNIFPYHDWESSAPFSMSNRGLRLELHITPCAVSHGEDLYVATLECPAPPDYEGFLGIYLKHVFTGDNQYARVKPQVLSNLPSEAVLRPYMCANLCGFLGLKTSTHYTLFNCEKDLATTQAIK